MESRMDGKLTLAPCGPSLTAQTAEPHTAQCEQRQFWRSLRKVAFSIRSSENAGKILAATHHSCNPPPIPPYPVPVAVSGVSLPTGLKLLNRLFFLLLSPRPIG